MDNNGTYSWTPPGKAKRPRGDFKKFSKIILVAVVVLALMIGIGTCFYTIDDKQQGVVTHLARRAGNAGSIPTCFTIPPGGGPSTNAGADTS